MRKIPQSRASFIRMQWRLCLLSVVLAMIWPTTMHAEERITHTNPLNLQPEVRAAYERFYTLDYDGALSRFQRVEQAHPGDPMAADYVLETVLFHELYNRDLLDTTL